MKLLFKQRFFSWLDSYDIFDESGEMVFEVKGAMSWGHCLHIYDANHNHIGTVKEEIFSFQPKFAMYTGDTYVGAIKKSFTFLKPKFTLNCNDWQVDGDFMEWNYSVADSRNIQIMHANKMIWNFTDTYEIDVSRNEDVLYSLMIVLAIDAAKCSND